MSKKDNSVISLLDDDEDEDLKLAISLSLQKPLETNPLRFNKLTNSPSPPTSISFRDLIGKNLENALFTAYTVDLEWLLKELPSSTTFTVVRHWEKPDKEGHFIVSPRCTVVHPKLLPMGHFHAKLSLLTYPTYLRVVVSSSNLSKEDWSQIHQNVWYQDFPKTKTASTSAFGTELMNFIAQLKLNPKFLLQYDFSSANVSLVCSVPGYHTGADLTKYGHLRLSTLVGNTALKSILKEKVEKDEICFQASSMGNLNSKWLKEFFKSCGTNYVETEEQPTKKKKSSSESKPNVTQFSILYPTKNQVSISDISASEIVCLAEKYWESESFPKHLFCNLVPKEPKENHLFHSKLLFRLVKTDKQTEGWCYAGSHNFSAAAWGRFQKNESQLHISNYEIGVFFDTSRDWINTLPYKLPPIPYTSEDEPWIMDKHKDSLGAKCVTCNDTLPMGCPQKQCPKCFKCETCGKQLSKFFEVNEKFYCKEDFEKQFLHNCFKCKQQIKNGIQFKKALGNVWHLNCFCCFICNKQIGNEFYEENSNPLCKSCGDLVFNE